MSILSLDKFKSSTSDCFDSGTWIVAYHDRTHLKEEFVESGDQTNLKADYIELGQVEVEEHTQQGDALFWFRPHSLEELEQDLSKAWKKGNVKGSGNSKNGAGILLKQLTESMVRLGLAQPFLEVYPPFVASRPFATVVLDTNALRNGAIRHLKEQFHRIQLWVIIPTVSLIEIGERAANIKKNANRCDSKNITFIQTRPQVTVAPEEVKWLKKNLPTETLDLAPELMRAVRGVEAGDRGADRTSINDRLILEGIKDLRRQRSLLEGVYLMSSDKDMSWLAQLEGIHTIYPAVPDIQEFSDGIYSLRYSLESRTYISCSIHRFLWDLTHVFSQIKVRCTSGPQEGTELTLCYYYPTKLVNDWVDDKLEVTDLGSRSTTDTI